MFFVKDGWVDALNLIDSKFPYRKDDFYKAIKSDQMAQQEWWWTELKKFDLPDNFKVNVYASGYGLYNVSLLIDLGADDIMMYDYDKEVTEINWRLNGQQAADINYNQETLDVVFDHEWVRKDVDLVLNTSCEVMFNFNKMRKHYNGDTIFVLQGTSKAGKGNINVVHSLDEFILTTGLTDVWYEGEKDGRYMVIGK